MILKVKRSPLQVLPIKVEFSKVYSLLAQVNGIEQTLFELIHSDCQLIIIGQALACKFLTFTGTITKDLLTKTHTLCEYDSS